MPVWLRQALEFGPVAIFFVVMLTTNVFIATGVLMGLMTVSALVAWAIEGRVSGLILFGLIAVLVFGTLTLVMQDETFIKIRPSIQFSAMAAILVLGLLLGRLFLRSIFEYAFKIDDAGWRILTWRMAAFFVFLAVANHLVWTNFSAEFWAGYKLFGVMPMFMAFFMAQTPLIMRHALPEDDAKTG
jgi:intracellular septation protein